MLLNIFKSNQRIAGVGVLILSLVLWIPGYFKQSAIVVNSKIPFIEAFNFLHEKNWINITLTSILIGGQAIYLNYLVNYNKLLKTNSYVLAFFYVLLNGACYKVFSFNAIILANTFLLLGLHQLFRLYNMTDSASVIFNAALFFGISTLVYPPLIVLFPLIWIALSYLRSPKAKDFLVAIIGFLLPFVYWFTYLFLIDEFDKIDIGFIFQNPIINQELIIEPFSYFFGLLGVILLLALFSSISFLNRTVVKTRKLFVLIILLLLSCLPILFFNEKDYIALFLTLILPGSIVISNYILNLRKGWQAELLTLLLLTTIVVSYFL